jgi:glycerate kinase
MRILIATDSFKDCLSSLDAGMAIRRGILHELIDAEIKVLPIADGGEGTLNALVTATNGKYISVCVHDPIMRTISAQYGISGDSETAFIEIAAASGIERLTEAERNPWNTSTFGTGELILSALDSGCRKIIIGIGGSATNDCGAGMAYALGARFFDGEGSETGFTGGEIGKVKCIDIAGFDQRIAHTQFIVACDVNNPLTGPQGAAYIYAPQKGANANMVRQLNENLCNFASCLHRTFHGGIESIPGAGAAGGLGAGLIAFADARLESGFQVVNREIQLDKYIQWADLVITGEGRIDNQTQYGKTPFGVALAAKKFDKPVIALAGSLGDGYTELYRNGFDAIFSIIDSPMTRVEALTNASELLERCTRSVIRLAKLKL